MRRALAFFDKKLAYAHKHPPTTTGTFWQRRCFRLANENENDERTKRMTAKKRPPEQTDHTPHVCVATGKNKTAHHPPILFPLSPSPPPLQQQPGSPSPLHLLPPFVPSCFVSLSIYKRDSLMFRTAIKSTAFLTVSVPLCGYVWARSTMGSESLSRMIKYDSVAVPLIVEYKFLEARCGPLAVLLPSVFPAVTKEEEQRRFNLLHEKWAKPLYDVFMELGGFYYKSGQKIASNFGGIFPPIYTTMYEPFLNDIPPRTKEDIRSVVESELGSGRTLESVFSTWDEVPLGCASIGQVHRATLRSSGQRVVVKVQNPRARVTFEGDVLAMRILTETFSPQHAAAFDEIQKQFKTEFDYRGECRNAIEIRKNLQDGGFGDRIVVPRVYEELCTERLLVMEEIAPSVTLHAALDAQAETLARSKGLSKASYLADEKERNDREVKALAKEGKLITNVSSRQYETYIFVSGVDKWARRFGKDLWNGTVGWALPQRYNFASSSSSSSSSSKEMPLLNAAKLIDDLLNVHGHEVLLNGCFNADP